MDKAAEEPAGVAVVRAWMESGPPRTLKIRVVAAPDVTGAERVIGVTAEIDEACSIVRDWLASIAEGAPSAGLGIGRRP